MKKRIILFVGYFLLLGGVVPVWGMTPEIRLIGAQRYLQSVQERLDNFQAQQDVQGLLRHFQDAESNKMEMEEELGRLNQERPQGARTQEHILYSIESAEQNLEHAQGELAELQNTPLYKGLVQLRDAITGARQDVASLEQQAPPLPAPAVPSPVPVPVAEPSVPPEVRPVPAPPRPQAVPRVAPEGASRQQLFVTTQRTTYTLDAQGNETVGQIKQMIVERGWGGDIESFDLIMEGKRLINDEPFNFETAKSLGRIHAILRPRRAVEEDLPPAAEPSAPAPGPQPPPPLSKPTKISPAAKVGIGIGVGTAAALAAAGALYTGLKWYQRKSIRRVINKYDLNLADFSPTQRDAMAAAFRASYRVPGAIKRLSMLARKSEFVSHTVPAETMWRILAEIYYRKSPTLEDVQQLKERVVR